ncbi:GNAT family N-acetyltransferase [Cellulomonas alba]|uniref:GNAT family N-acetyltransferase n=1 Tax=Cellulomonas alba TaxID=3053467 RepID=A0ABT7SKD3_9CELL|nr:GNAT family N-acetyltransferase [Cellulomonas alba]MDM7856638.1 GNAT family N-acetyltransferase [Cellulomonas alba]
MTDDAPRHDGTDDVVIRPADRPGDLGWMVLANAETYAEQFGWDGDYEALVARIVADFAARHDVQRERAWIAELDGRRVGCVLCVDAGGERAQLRILLVTPDGRGRRVGSRLVEEVTGFARERGYVKVVLWTNSVLETARHLYERAGFTLVDESPHRSFGVDLVGQNWELTL